MGKTTGYYTIAYKDKDGKKKTSKRIFADSKGEPQDLFVSDTGFEAGKAKFVERQFKKPEKAPGWFDFWTNKKQS